MGKGELRAEIEALRREIAGLRTARPSARPSESAAAENATEAGAGVFADLAREIFAFAEETENGVVNHPLISVVGALVLGVLIGRVLHR
jgi:hypothetical protein